MKNKKKKQEKQENKRTRQICNIMNDEVRKKEESKIKQRKKF